MSVDLDFLRGMRGAPAAAADYIEDLEAERDRLRKLLKGKDKLLDEVRNTLSDYGYDMEEEITRLRAENGRLEIALEHHKAEVHVDVEALDKRFSEQTLIIGKLEAENARLREALERIRDLPLVADFPFLQCMRIARQALEGNKSASPTSSVVLP